MRHALTERGNCTRELSLHPGVAPNEDSVWGVYANSVIKLVIGLVPVGWYRALRVVGPVRDTEGTKKTSDAMDVPAAKRASEAVGPVFLIAYSFYAPQTEMSRVFLLIGRVITHWHIITYVLIKYFLTNTVICAILILLDET